MLTVEDKIKKLNSIGVALTKTTKLQDLFELIVTSCREFTNSDGGSLFTLEGDKLIFRVAQNDTLAKRPGERPPFKAFQIPLSKKSVSGYVAVTGEIVHADDCYTIDPSKGYGVDKSFDEKMNYRSKSMLTVPMLDDKGAVSGVIQLINAMNEKGEAIPFAEDTIELMMSIASQAAVALQNARLISNIKNLFAAFVKYSATAIDERSPHTAGHTRRVAGMSMRVANCINEQTAGEFAEVFFSDAELEELWFAAWLHDIGKIAVKEAVLEKNSRISWDRMNWILSRLHIDLLEMKLDHLNDPNFDEETFNNKLESVKSDIEFLNKLNTAGFLPPEDEERLKNITARKYRNIIGEEHPMIDEFELSNLAIKRGNLTDDEWLEMRSHVVKTRTIVAKIPFTKELSNVGTIAGGHHEMLNGTGYPDKLTEEQLPLQARILAVADVFDALTAADRPYKKAIPLDISIKILREEVEKGRMDSRVVELVVEKELYEGHKEDQAEYPWKTEVF